MTTWRLWREASRGRGSEYLLHELPIDDLARIGTQRASKPRVAARHKWLHRNEVHVHVRRRIREWRSPSDVPAGVYRDEIVGALPAGDRTGVRLVEDYNVAVVELLSRSYAVLQVQTFTVDPDFTTSHFDSHVSNRTTPVYTRRSSTGAMEADRAIQTVAYCS